MNNICTETLNLFNVDRVAIASYPKKGDYSKWTIHTELKATPDIIGKQDIEYPVIVKQFLGKYIVDEGKDVIIDNLEKSDFPDFYKTTYKKMRVKSTISVPIKKGDEKWGMLGLFESKRYKKWTRDDIELLHTIAEQVYTAINQAELYTSTKSFAEKEALSLKIINIIRSTLDLNELSSTICSEIGKAFNVDTVDLVLISREIEEEFREEKISALELFNKILNVRWCNYNLLELIHKYPPSEKWTHFWFDLVYSAKNLVVNDFTEDKNIPEYVREQYQKWEVGSMLATVLKEGDDHLGVIGLSMRHVPREWTNEEIELLNIISTHLYIAVKQAQLYSTLNEQAKRESLLRKIISTIRSTLDLNEIKHNVVNELGKTFKADRCYFRAFDKRKNKFLPPDVEYLGSPEIESLLNVEPDQEGLKVFFEILGERVEGTKPIIIDIDSVRGMPTEKYFENVGILVDYAMPILNKEDELTYLVLHYSKKRPDLSEKDLLLMETIADHVKIAIDQSRLYEQEKKAVERETLLRDLMNALKSTLDLNEILDIIGQKLLLIFRVQRVLISKKTESLDESVLSEYKSSPEIVGGFDIGIARESREYWRRNVVETGIGLVIDNVPESNLPDFLKAYYSRLDIRSILSSVVQKEEKWGLIILSSIGNYRYWTDDEIQLLEAVTAQAYIVIKQAELYEKSQKQAQREVLIRTIVDTVRSSLNLEEIQNKMVTEVGKYFNADRCYFRRWNKKTGELFSVEIEYLSSPDVSSLIGVTPLPEAIKYFIDMAKNDKFFAIIENTEDYIEKNNLQGSILDKYLKSVQVKSDYPVIVRSTENELIALVLHYTKKTVKLQPEDVEVLEILAGEAAMAIEQARLYEQERKALEKSRKQAQREVLIRIIVDTVRSSLNLEEMQNKMVTEIGKFFNADRCFFRRSNKKNREHLPVTVEYRSSPEVSSLIGVPPIVESMEHFLKNLKEGKYILTIEDVEDYIKTNNLQGSILEKYLNNAQIKSDYPLVIIDTEDELISLVLHYTKKAVKLEPEDLEVLEILVRECATAIEQARLYEHERKTAKKEFLSRKLIEAIRSSMDVDDVLNVVCNELSKLFGSERITVTTFPNPNNFEEFLIRKEYLASESVKSLTTATNLNLLSKIWAEALFYGEGYLVIENISKSDYPDFFKKAYEELGVKSIIGLPLKKEVRWGMLILANYKDYKKWTKDEIEFLQTITDQIYIAVNQAELYMKASEQAKREELQRKIIEAIRGTLDVNEMKKELITKIGEALDADSCFILEYDSKTDNFMVIDEYSEYLKSPDQKSLIGFDFESEEIKNFSANYKKGKAFIVNNADEFIKENHLENTNEEKVIRNLNLKSGYGIPIYFKDELMGLLTIHYITRQVILTENDYIFLKNLGSQAAIALHQSRLYLQASEQAKREELQRKIIEAIRSTLDVNEMKKELITRIGEALDADSCFIVEYDSETDNFMILDEYSEYLKSPDQKSLIGFDFASEEIKNFSDDYKKGKEFIANNIDEFIKKNHLENTNEEKVIRNLNLKSAYGIPIYFKDELMGLLSVHYMTRQVYLTKNDYIFLKNLGSQAAIGLYQSRLYKNQKFATEREALLRRIIEIIRNTLDIKDLKKNIAEIFGKTLNLDRCYIQEYDPNKNVLTFVDEYSEYRSSENVKSVVGFDFSAFPGLLLFKKLGKERSSIIAANVEEFINSYKDEINDDVVNYFENFNIKSGFQFSIFYGDEFLGILSGNYSKTFTKFPEDIKYLETLANQVAIALHQSKLYDEVKRNAEKETVLREFIQKISSTLDINEIKTLITTTIGKLFNLDRCFILEYDSQREVFLPVNSEYRSSEDIKSLIGFDYESNTNLSEYRKKTKSEQVFSILNMKHYLQKESVNEDVLSYFKEYDIKGGFQVPIFYRGELLGLLINHFSQEMKTFPEDVNYLTTIANQIGIAMYQSKLYNSEKQTVRRETILREFVQKISSTLDINEIKMNITSSIGELMHLDRCFILEYDSVKDLLTFVDEYSEYRSSEDIKSLIGFDFSKETLSIFKDAGKAQTNIVALSVDQFINEYRELINEDVVNYFKEFDTRSGFQVPILYRDELLGLLVGHYSTLISEFPEDINFLRTIANQVGIAIYQSKLYISEKQTVQRELILREVIQKISSTLDVDEIKTVVTENVGKMLNLYRCFITEYDEVKDKFLLVDSEYRSNPDSKSLIGFDYETHEDYAVFKDYCKSRIPYIMHMSDQDGSTKVVIKDMRTLEILYESGPEGIGKVLDNYFKECNAKVAFAFQIYSGAKNLGLLIGHYEYETEVSIEDAKFLQIVANQVGIAIYQSKLYISEKQTVQRELILKNIINKLRSTLDTNEIKKIFTKSLGNIFNADRVIFADFNADKQVFLTVDENSEYLNEGLNKISLIGTDFRDPYFDAFTKFLIDEKEINIYDLDKFLKERNLENSHFEKLFRDWELKSSYNILVTFGEEIIGFFCLDYLQKSHELDENGLEFLRTMANQAGIGIHQANLYEITREQASRESLLRRIIEIIRSTLNINEIKKLIVSEMGKTIKSDRCLIIEYDQSNDIFLPVDEELEYRVSDKIKRMGNIAFEEDWKFFIDLVRKKQDCIFQDVDEFIKENQLQNKREINIIEEYGIESVLALPIVYGESLLGVFALSYSEKNRITDEIITLCRTITNQAGIALHQAKLYENEAKIAQRESLLRRIIEIIRSTLDINEIKKLIVTEMGKTIKSDRCLIIEYDQSNDIFLPVDEELEYRVSDKIKRMGNIAFEEDWKFFIDIARKKEDCIFQDMDEVIKENQLQNKRETNIIKEYNLKSALALPIIYGESVYGVFAVTFSEKNRITDEIINLGRTITNQAGIALHQAKLYENEAKTAQRELLLRRIIEIIRSTLDINEMKQNVVKEIGRTFNADRCYFRNYDKKNHKFFPVEVEHLSSPDISSLMNIEPDQEGLKAFMERLKREPEGFYIEAEEAKDLPLGQYMIREEYKASYAASVWENGDTLTYLVLIYVKTKPKLPKEYITLMRTIAKQLKIAIDQATLYKLAQETAEKERILREIVSQIKLAPTINEVYEYIISKLSKEFQCPRIIIFESPLHKIEAPLVKYEFISDENLKSLKNVKLPNACQTMLRDISDNLKPFIVNDSSFLHKDDFEAKEFFDEYSIRAMIIVPMVRYNKHIRVLGLLGLCQSKSVKWSEYEINLLNSIVETTVSIVWEATKLVEINEMRDTFISTLAHDLQVPLIGELKALEVLSTRPPEHPIGKYQFFIKEIINNNVNLYNQLTKLIDGYYYESGKKRLEFARYQIVDVIKEVVDSLKEKADEKSILITLSLADDIPLVYIDKTEISKALSYLLDNAVDYIQVGGTVEITALKEEHDIKICITDNGPGISLEIQKRLFERYETAVSIKRKIGTGLGLYLTKQIIEAHGGRIWYTTETGVGTTFCFTLQL